MTRRISPSRTPRPPSRCSYWRGHNGQGGPPVNMRAHVLVWECSTGTERLQQMSGTSSLLSETSLDGAWPHCLHSIPAGPSWTSKWGLQGLLLTCVGCSHAPTRPARPVLVFWPPSTCTTPPENSRTTSAANLKKKIVIKDFFVVQLPL